MRRESKPFVVKVQYPGCAITSQHVGCAELGGAGLTNAFSYPRLTPFLLSPWCYVFEHSVDMRDANYLPETKTRISQSKPRVAKAAGRQAAWLGV